MTISLESIPATVWISASAMIYRIHDFKVQQSDSFHISAPHIPANASKGRKMMGRNMEGKSS